MKIKNILTATYIGLFAQGCTTTDQVIQNRFDAGSLDQQAEEAQRSGNEAQAIILKDRANRKRNTNSLLLIIVDELFD